MEVIHSPCQRWKTLCFLYKLCLGGGRWLGWRWWKGEQEILPWVCLLCAGFEDRGASIFVHRGCINSTVSVLNMLYRAYLNMNLTLWLIWRKHSDCVRMCGHVTPPFSVGLRTWVKMNRNSKVADRKTKTMSWKMLKCSVKLRQIAE